MSGKVRYVSYEGPVWLASKVSWFPQQGYRIDQGQGGLWVEKRRDIRYEMQIILYFYHVLSGSVVIIQTHRPKLVITTIPKLTFCRIMVQIQQLLPKRQRMLPFVGRYIPASIMICYCYACCNMSEKISCVNYKDSILLSWQSLIVSCQ